MRKFYPRSKRSQEEMIGFALIIILVAVILLIFLGFSLRDSKDEAVQSYEAESFISAFLQYTTDCKDNYGYRSIKDIVSDCSKVDKVCLDERNPCEVLEFELKELIKESWKVGEDTPIKGYELNITLDNEEMLYIKEGHLTLNCKGAMQSLVTGGSIEIYFQSCY